VDVRLDEYEIETPPVLDDLMTIIARVTADSRDSISAIATLMAVAVSMAQQMAPDDRARLMAFAQRLSAENAVLMN
jgi:hypothetical protein